MKPRVSIIIPCKTIDGFTQTCLKKCHLMSYRDFEILLLPDQKAKRFHSQIRVIPTGKIFPAAKRNIGVARAKGAYCAFIDSDAYPRKDWLSNTVRIMEDKSIGAIGGPNLIPPRSPLQEQVGTDIIFSAMGVGAFPKKEYRPGLYEVNEIPSSNLIVRTSILKQIGGFDTGLLTAEDAKLCFLIKQLGHRVVYSDHVAVFHHRRPFLLQYLKSIRVYGRDKGLLLKELFSVKRMYYFMPTAFVFGIIAGALLSIFFVTARIAYLVAIMIYFAAAIIQALHFKGWKRRLLIALGIPLTHITYGIGFLEGFIRKKATETSRKHSSK